LHRRVVAELRRLDGALLESCRCYFGGGTRIVLELGEYRESKDIDLLCADRDGYRRLREAVMADSLGRIARRGLKLSREVRADQYGIRTRLGSDREPLKLEVIRESRIALAGTRVRGVPVPCLDHASAFAEKLLANADRGLDRSTLSRDAIDLAFMVQGWKAEAAKEGATLARLAYGGEVDRKLSAVVELLRTDRAYRARCIEALAIEDTKTLARGLERLTRGIRT
jgi:hypothetical protein